VLPALGAALLLSTHTAGAADCTPESGMSPCLDSEALWLPPRPSQFVSIPTATRPTLRSVFLGAGLSHAQQPILLTAASPDPEGREIRVVGRSLTLTLLGALPLGEQWDVGLALPAAVSQSGTGVEGVTDQQDSHLASHALRDPRLSVGFAWFAHPDHARRTVDARTLLRLSLPLGNESALAGERSLVFAPALVLSVDHDRFFAGSLLGPRLRQPVELAGARLGTQLEVSVGAGLHLLPRQSLSVGVETWMLPVLVSQERTVADGTRVEDASLVPAEWMLSLRAAPPCLPGLSLQLGGGTGIPLSSERRTGEDTEHFAGVTTPSYRLVATVRHGSR
jgi:hypothetical protein